MKKYYIFIAFLIVFSAVAAAAQSYLAKDTVADSRKVQDIHEISSLIKSFYAREDRLPESLSAVDLPSEISDRVSDYEYRAVDEDSFELCAEFMTDTTDSGHSKYVRRPGYPQPEVHEAGRQCFTYEAELDFGEPAPPGEPDFR